MKNSFSFQFSFVRKFSQFCFALILVLQILPNSLFSQTLCQKLGSQAPALVIGIPGNPSNLTFLSTLYPNGATLANQKIRINGILKVDVNLNLNNCIIELTSGAEIVTEGNVLISSVSSQYYSCGQMWKGFYIKNPAQLYMAFGEIEDAEFAVTLEDGTVSAFWGVIFDRNHVGIKNGTALSTTSVLNITYFEGNVFDFSSSLSAPFTPNLTPAYTGRSITGVLLNNVVTVLASYFNPTIFQNMANGVIANESDLFVYGCHFENLTGPAAADGNGISSNNGSLTAYQCDFMLNRWCGIVASSCDLDIANNRFETNANNGPVNGIRSVSNIKSDFIYIRNNSFLMDRGFSNFRPFHNGIYVERNSRSTVGNPTLNSFDISNNEFTMHGLLDGQDINRLEQRAIWIHSPNPSLDLATVSNNTFAADAQVRHVLNGIQIQAGMADKYHVSGNAMTYDVTPGLQGRAWAFSILNGSGVNHYIHHNDSRDIDMNSTTRDSHFCDFHIEDCNNVTLCNNFASNSEHGFHFYGTCNGLGFFENSMNFHLRSIRVQDNLQTNSGGFIGNHVRTSNRWNQNNSPAWNNSSIGFQFVTCPSQLIPFSPGNIGGVGNNLILIQNGAEVGCQPPPGFINDKDEFDELVIIDSVPGNDRAKWENRVKLMYKLLRFPELMAENSDMQLFFSEGQNQDYGKVAQYRYKYWESVNVISAQENSNLVMFDTERAGIINNLTNNAYTNQTPGLEIFSSSSMLARKTLLLSLKDNFVNRLNLKKYFNSKRDSVILIAIQQCQNVSSDALQVQSWKTLDRNNMYEALGISDSSSTITDLLNIANECPEVAGAAPMQAIYEIALKGIESLIPHEETGLICGDDREDKLQTNLKSGLKLSPNPATSRIEVYFSNSTTGSWSLISTTGELILSGSVTESNSLSINTASISNGVYLFILDSSGSVPILIEKVIIQH